MGLRVDAGIAGAPAGATKSNDPEGTPEAAFCTGASVLLGAARPLFLFFFFCAV